MSIASWRRHRLRGLYGRRGLQVRLLDAWWRHRLVGLPELPLAALTLAIVSQQTLRLGL